MYVAAGSEFTATLVDPGGLDDLALGARIEIPVTRAIVDYWKAATLSGYVWSVVLEAPPTESAQPGSDPEMDAALKAGEFNIVWLDGLEPPTVEFYVPLFCSDSVAGSGSSADWPAVDVDEVTPSVDDVAALEGTRRMDDSVEEQLTFTADTRPTDTQVQALIDQAVPVVLAQLNPTFPPDYYSEVSHAIALYAAILVEGSYYREQLNVGSVALYRALLEQTLTAINSQVTTELTSSGGGRLY